MAKGGTVVGEAYGGLNGCGWRMRQHDHDARKPAPAWESRLLEAALWQRRPQ
jgi:hypothetical protein